MTNPADLVTLRTHRHGRRRTSVALVLVLLVALLAACSADDASFDATSSSDGAAAPDPVPDLEGLSDGSEEEAAGHDGEQAVDGSVGDAPSDRQSVQLAALGRERIRTAWITLELEEPDAAVDGVARVAEARGGFVALADLARDDRTGELGGTVTVRVPSEELLATLDALEELAVDAPVRRIEEQDVSAQLTDLRAQLTNLTAYEEELRALLTEIRQATSDPDDLLPIVERLQSVRSDIDRIRAQRAGLEDRVALSTITVTLTSTPTEAPIVTTSWTPMRTVEEALAATGRFLAGVADAGIWLGVTLLPVLLVLGGPPLAVWWWWQRRRVTARAAAPPPPAA
ncbi:DUF4349 domain-containing protein [Nitriliruptor alkaliphilus]|uniref:DUF4349 domain-containing protein n=1 Tax=Nitriliruptor alkaliphilus TaxID=427918 RepID=UPI000696BBAD|nr:DUF4349 domain-containing protein [Nitriliruptor alkaliphilus]